jgi:hypothetical protein
VCAGAASTNFEQHPAIIEIMRTLSVLRTIVHKVIRGQATQIQIQVRDAAGTEASVAADRRHHLELAEVHMSGELS